MNPFEKDWTKPEPEKQVVLNPPLPEVPTEDGFLVARTASVSSGVLGCDSLLAGSVGFLYTCPRCGQEGRLNPSAAWTEAPRCWVGPGCHGTRMEPSPCRPEGEVRVPPPGFATACPSCGSVARVRFALTGAFFCSNLKCGQGTFKVDHGSGTSGDPCFREPSLVADEQAYRSLMAFGSVRCEPLVAGCPEDIERINRRSRSASCFRCGATMATDQAFKLFLGKSGWSFCSKRCLRAHLNGTEASP